MPASQKFEPKDPWGRPFIMPENVGLYCVLFPMGLLLIPVFTATGNYTGGAAGARARSRKGERLCRDVFSLFLSLFFPSFSPFSPFFSPPVSPFLSPPTLNLFPLFLLNARVKKKKILPKDIRTCVCMCVLAPSNPLVLSLALLRGKKDSIKNVTCLFPSSFSHPSRSLSLCFCV